MTVLSAARVVTGEKVLVPGWVEYDQDRIVATGPGRPDRDQRDLWDATIVPGFVDMHVHGGGGGAFTNSDPSSALRAVQTHRGHGTTTTMASLVTAAPGELLDSVSMLAGLYESGVIAGIHLEGPWISPMRRGAHDPAHLRHPDPAEISRLLIAGRGAVRMVTLAPELPGGHDAIRQVVDAGAVAAIGHTDATYDEVVQAIALGARVATHLFNAMRPVHQREPGPVVALLEDSRVTVELIADGMHLHPALYRQICAAVGEHRVSLVTDAMAAAGLGDGQYRLGSMEVNVVEAKARIAGSDTIAGSTATMDVLFRNAVRDGLRPTTASFDRSSDAVEDHALLRAVQQTCVNPARTMGLADVGSLSPGKRAHLVVLGSDAQVREVIRAEGSGVPVQPGGTRRQRS